MYYANARYYDPRTSIFLSVDPLAEKYPSHSPYTYCLNNPIIYTDPDGRDAIITIKGNTVTISATIITTNANADQLKTMQKAVDNYYNNKAFTGTVDGKQYNVNFQITVLEGEPDAYNAFRGVEGVNYVSHHSKGDEYDRVNGRSYVSGSIDSMHIIGDADERTYAHETGHLLGLADRYFVYIGTQDPKDTMVIARPGTHPNDLMGVNGNQVSQEGINALLEYGVKNQVDGKTIITRENLRRNGKPDLLNGDYDILKMKDPSGYRLAPNLTH